MYDENRPSRGMLREGWRNGIMSGVDALRVTRGRRL